ncbi:hypothetical protein KY330_05240 [Candidatus Woesearchaeota archaeon]|nr:hypothetical protein [Candidatus Woesearchaeota archaeon]
MAEDPKDDKDSKDDEVNGKESNDNDSNDNSKGLKKSVEDYLKDYRQNLVLDPADVPDFDCGNEQKRYVVEDDEDKLKRPDFSIDSYFDFLKEIDWLKKGFVTVAAAATFLNPFGDDANANPNYSPFPKPDKEYHLVKEDLKDFKYNINIDEWLFQTKAKSVNPIINPVQREEIIEPALNFLEEVFDDFSEVDCNTMSVAVWKGEIEGDKVFAKVSDRVAMIMKEAEFYKDAWKHAILRPIIPKLWGNFRIDKAALLITHDVNETKVAVEDEILYLSKKNELLDKLSERLRIDKSILEADDKVVDMLNRALLHFHMREHKDNPVYQQGLRPSVLSSEEISDRVSRGSLAEVKGNVYGSVEELVRLIPLYNFLVSEAAGYDNPTTTLCQFDARPENVWVNGKGIRVIGDFGYVKPGTPEFDLARMEALDTDFYVECYAQFRNMLGDDLPRAETEELKRRTRTLAFIDAIRLGARKLMANKPDAFYYIGLAKHYSRNI